MPRCFIGLMLFMRYMSTHFILHPLRLKMSYEMTDELYLLG